MKLAPITAGRVMLVAFAWRALASDDLVVFPERYADGVHYATVKRANITEVLYASRAAIKAAKSGQPLAGFRVNARPHEARPMMRAKITRR